MRVRLFFAALLLSFLVAPAAAQSINYHVEKVALETRGLQLALNDQSEQSWGQRTALEDLRRLQAASEAFLEALDEEPDLEDQTQFLVQLEVAASRVRTSREIAGYDDEQQLALDRILMETKEMRRNLASQKEQADQRRRARRTSPRFSLGVGFGGGWFPYNCRPIFFRPRYICR